MFENLRSLLQRDGIRPYKRGGQHHVIDQTILERMVNLAEISGKETILEIGAGVGNLTALLAQRGGRVVAVEKDDRLVRILRKQLKNFSNVQILHCDALRMQLPYFDKVVSNLPYWISSEIIFKLLEKRFKLGVLMLQKEFADRLVAKPGTEDYSRLAVNVHYRADVELHDEVPPAAFYPEPKVTSRIVIIRPRESAFKIFDEKKFSALVRALFQHRRQRVRNALLRSFTEVFPGRNLSKAKRRKFIDEKIPKELADARVIDLYPEKFGEISNLLTSP